MQNTRCDRTDRTANAECNTMKKHPYSECFFIVCIISRILSWTVIYLGGRLLARSSGTLSACAQSTALHWGKDFAVSPLHHCKANLRRDSIGFRLRRHCSHLLDYSRRGLPATFCSVKSSMFGLSSKAFHLRELLRQLSHTRCGL